VPFGEHLKLGKSLALLAHTAKQSLPCGAEGSIPPARVLGPWVALLPLQPPLQLIIHDPPGRAEMGYERL
jgi:hypothetical protein